MTGVVPLWFKLTVAMILLTLFSVSFLWDMVSDEYEVPAAMYPVVLFPIGYIFGSEAVKGMARRVVEKSD